MSGIYQINKTTLVGIASALRQQFSVADKISAQDFNKKILQMTGIKHYVRPEFAWDEEKATEAVLVAKSYLDNESLFKYQGSHGVFDDEYIEESTGKYLVDCSTFVGLVLRGIPFELSKYVTGNDEDIKAKNDMYPWADPYLDSNSIRWAHEYARYFYLLGRTFCDMSCVKPGDILFHWKESADNVFGRIWHVSMVYNIGEDGTITCIHALREDNNDGIWTFDMDESLNNDGGYLFAARPNYSQIYEIEEGIEPEPIIGNLLVEPWGSSYETGINGVTYSKASNGIGIEGTGKAIGGWSSFYYRTSTRPLVLEAGRYRLSGCPKRNDITDNTKWNINLYDADTKAHLARDTGDGVVFELTKETNVYICSTVGTGIIATGYIWYPALVRVL